MSKGMIIENIHQYQPKFREWLESINAKDGDEVKIFDYMAWVSKRMKEGRGQ